MTSPAPECPRAPCHRLGRRSPAEGPQSPPRRASCVSDTAPEPLLAEAPPARTRRLRRQQSCHQIVSLWADWHPLGNKNPEGKSGMRREAPSTARMQSLSVSNSATVRRSNSRTETVPLLALTAIIANGGPSESLHLSRYHPEKRAQMSVMRFSSPRT